jgi:hypothetical protein
MATNPVPLQLAPAKGLWYPTYPPNTPQWLIQAFTQAFNAIYQMQGQLLPTGVFAAGSGTVKVPLAPNWTLITNCSITFPRAGLWTVFGMVTFDIKDAADINYIFQASLLVAGLAASTPSTVVVKPNAAQAGNPQILIQGQPTQVTVCGIWQFRVTANGTAQLRVQKDKNADATLKSLADASNSSIGAIWCGT